MSSQSNRLSTQSLPTRNPRRRTRQEIDGGSSSLRQTRSKRSKLDDGSSLQRRSSEQGDVQKEPSLNGRASYPIEPLEEPLKKTENGTATSHDTDIVQRRTLREEGAHVLARTECYQAAQLQGVPDELHDKEEDHNGMTLPSASLALAVTADKAYVWSYAHSGPASALREFTLPHPSRARDPLPIATLVKQGAKGDTGLVVISAKLGKITFWENIDNAAALSLFEQKRNGTEGDVGGLFSGETITNITSAEPAGYILSFSSGRVAQLSLWDSQSRPSISVRFLKSSSANKGYLGGFWSALGVGGYLKDVASVRAQMSRTRGLADVLVASEAAVFQYWQLGWSSQQPVLVKELDAAATLRAALADRLQDLPSSIQDIALVDCIISSSDSHGGMTTFNLVCLSRVTGTSFSKYVLVELVIGSDGSAESTNVYPLNSYAAPLTDAQRWKPQLASPSESATVFAVFEKAITIFSPRAGAFQETLYLKSEEDIVVTGVNSEAYDTRKEEAAIVVHIRGNGPARVAVQESMLEQSGGRLSARTQIEQAVFYGTRPLNPFDLGRSPEIKYPQTEVEEAVLSVSNDILRSRYPNVLPALTQVDRDMQRRSYALENLAKHIKHAGFKLSRSTKWDLLANAERLSAARRVWTGYNQTNTGHRSEVRLLPELIEYLNPERKSFSEDVSDQLRQFLRFDLDKLQDLLPFTYLVIYKLAQRSDVRDSDQLLQIVCDGGDLIKDTLGEAFSFRQQHKWLYGLDDEPLVDGILAGPSNYQGLPAIWTSTRQSIRKIKEFIENAQTAVIDEPDSKKSCIAKIAHDNSLILSEWSRAVEERHRWSLGQDDIRWHEAGEKDYKEAVEWRSQLLTRLADIGQVYQGLDLAQQYSDMPALTKLIRRYGGDLMALCHQTRKGPLDESAADRAARLTVFRQAVDDTKVLETRIRSLFDQFGPPFTHPYFKDFLDAGVSATFLDLAASYVPEAKEYLTSNSNLRKIAWMNDIINLHDHAGAAENLTLAVDDASDSYDKEVVASFAKLAVLAASEAGNETLPLASYTRRNEAQAQIIDIQQVLFDHVHPILYGCLDQDAELQQLMAELGSGNVDQRASVAQLLEQSFAKIIQHQALGPEELADVLSLMDAKDLREFDPNAMFDARYKHGLALRALSAARDLADASEARLDFAQQTVWRRVYIEDDWKQITSVKYQNDDQQEALLRDTVLFATMLECMEAGIISDTAEPPRPQALLKVGTTPESWSVRFPDTGICTRLANDTAAEIAWLTEYIDNCDVEGWVTTAYELAKRHIAETKTQADAEAAQLAEYGDAAMRFESGRDEHAPSFADAKLVDVAEANSVMDLDGE